MTPKLSLKKERLGELTAEDLRRVAGGIQRTLVECLSLTGPCYSWQGCTTANSCGCENTWNCA